MKNPLSHYNRPIDNNAGNWKDHAAASRQKAAEAQAQMAKMMEKLKLEVNQQKTRACRVPEESFDFLGYTLGRCYRVKTDVLEPSCGSRQ
jgi:hypothetical protein